VGGVGGGGGVCCLGGGGGGGGGWGGADAECKSLEKPGANNSGNRIHCKTVIPRG